MMSLPAIVGISLGAAGFVAFSRKSEPWGALKKTGYFIAASIGTMVVLLAVNFGL